jgi:hypothetical protein
LNQKALSKTFNFKGAQRLKDMARKKTENLRHANDLKTVNPESVFEGEQNLKPREEHRSVSAYSGSPSSNSPPNVMKQQQQQMLELQRLQF